MATTRSRPFLSERNILLVIILGVLVPVVLMSAAGIVALVIGGVENIVIGTLVVSFALGSLGAAVTILVMVRRRARLARQQVTFLTNVTHELRTPLAAIRLYAQTLQLDRAATDAERRECAEAILRDTERLGQLVERVLQWRKIAEGRRLYERRPDAVEPALREALDAFRGLLRSGEATLELDLRATRPVDIDRAGITEAVLNLLVNAHKYTGDRKVIALRSRDVEDGVEIEVEDNGIGIPTADQGRIFEPFHRVDDRLRSQAPGVGLGLAIVKDVVSAHDGRLRVRSEPGKGSAFTVFLPAAPPAREGGAS
ncbi:MAG: HAMP domain-containing histidine kinase [Deltaproteobacteria bacterium]|nr:HAMP domain-containing histidine kinase [Deltaproteobacteria bacterium]